MSGPFLDSIMLQSPILMQIPKTPYKYMFQLAFTLRSPILMQIPQNSLQIYVSTCLYASKSNLDADPPKTPYKYMFLLNCMIQSLTLVQNPKTPNKYMLLLAFMLQSPILMQIHQNSPQNNCFHLPLFFRLQP